jgi:hypothetical protein
LDQENSPWLEHSTLFGQKDGRFLEMFEETDTID